MAASGPELRTTANGNAKEDMHTGAEPLLAENAPGSDPLASELGSSGVTLEWKGACFQVPSRQILKGITGAVEPGRLLSIMGPSGAGKSTMLNLLAGRLPRDGVSGSIRVNGREIDPVDFRSQVAYVMQEDALFATQTPREALEFSAALRLPKSISRAERSDLVDDMLVELGLVKCADTFVGSVRLRGISGGEKKRTAIGIELISQPQILFLDEPTSGLDSFAAYNVVKLLRQLAQCGVTIVCTIHQPSSEVFALFDDVMLLADGQLVYHGTCSRMLPYFAHHGWECKPNYNPADFVMFLMQEDSRGDGSPESVTAHAAHLGSLWGQSGGLDLERQAVGTPNRRITQRSPYMDRLAALGDTHDGDRYNAFVQLGWLARREARNLIRNKGALYAQFGVTVFLNLIIGLVFKDAGKWTDRDVQEGTQMSEAIQNHFGALTQVGIGAMFGLAQPALLSFPLERPVFLREHATDMYRAWPYFLSKCMCEVPMALIQTALIFVVTYWLIGFQGEFFFLSLACALLGITAASTSLLVGSVADNVTTAIQATPMLFVPQLLFSGFFISINKIPAFMRCGPFISQCYGTVSQCHGTVSQCHDQVSQCPPVLWLSLIHI
eukprot:TRINITY_DN5040_c0_g1_i12.p1 TRINITY_DN5040_c0_g1~~TRINITY_DN5040_c0_g1_i12.p1  ORF type:complete len:610 (+),score=130.43 TRINITY_DN5040_c0_g1_i12:203-2032(+)